MDEGLTDARSNNHKNSNLMTRERGPKSTTCTNGKLHPFSIQWVQGMNLIFLNLIFSAVLDIRFLEF